MRAAVETWTSASVNAAVANHALAAIVDEKTDVTMSRVGRVRRSPSRCIRRPRLLDTIATCPGAEVESCRVVLVFVAVTGVTYALAEWHPARPGVPKAAAAR